MAIGVQGVTASPNGVGAAFTNLAGGTSAVIEGNGPGKTVFVVDASGNGFYAGNLNVTGKLTKGSGSFKIDHPLDPANKYLSHSFVESPDMMNVYNGNITTDRHGLATITLPDYFEALNRDFRYQLTVIGPVRAGHCQTGNQRQSVHHQDQQSVSQGFLAGNWHSARCLCQCQPHPGRGRKTACRARLLFAS